MKLSLLSPFASRPTVTVPTHNPRVTTVEKTHNAPTTPSQNADTEASLRSQLYMTLKQTQ